MNGTSPKISYLLSLSKYEYRDLLALNEWIIESKLNLTSSLYNIFNKNYGLLVPENSQEFSSHFI